MVHVGYILLILILAGEIYSLRRSHKRCENSLRIQDGIIKNQRLALARWERKFEQPFLTSVNRHMDEIGLADPLKPYYRDGANYGFNLRDNYCRDLIKQRDELIAEVQSLTKGQFE